jgi:cephalosporin hydroxylase
MIVIEDDKLIVSEMDIPSAEYAIGSPEAFRILSRLWLRSGWDAKYVYSFTWLGRPIIQLPEDLLRIQEVIFTLRPDLIIETGVAHGGSLIFYASLCKALGQGRVIGIDREIRPWNRQAVEAHNLSRWIRLIEGDSVSPPVIAEVRKRIPKQGCVLVLLDSCHTKAHVRAELEIYSAFVTPGSYIVAMDGIMEELAGAPRTNSDWVLNNPRQAAREFAAEHPDFIITEPDFLFNEGSITERVTYWPGAFLRRKQSSALLTMPTGRKRKKLMAQRLQPRGKRTR